MDHPTVKQLSLRIFFSIILFCLAVVAPLCLSGCSTFNAYEQVDRQFAGNSYGRVQIQRGQPRPVIDAAGRVLALPNRIALGDPLVDNHSVSPQTEMEITNYLEQNGLNTVLLRSNQYAPLGEYKRMVANKKIRPIWKATFGNYNLLKYTLLPGRLVGGDWYNPYSDSLHVYSDTPVVAISRAAYAQDINTRVNPGAYAAIKDVPLAGLGHETTATKLTLQYYENQSPEQYQAARDLLYPSLGASYGGQLASFVPYGDVVGRLVGGGIGRLTNKFQRR